MSVGEGPDEHVTSDSEGRVTPAGDPSGNTWGKVMRVGWSLADQVLSALTNMVMSVLVARSVDAVSFSHFAVAFLIFSLTIGVVRALVSGPLGIRNSADRGAARVASAGSAMGASALIALPVSVGLLVAWALIGGGFGRTLACLALVLPILMVQDTCRYGFFAWAAPQSATLIDATWAVVQFGISGVLIATGTATTPTLVLAWGAGAAVAAGVACVRLRALPTLRPAWVWLRQHWDLSRYLLGSYVVDQGAFQGGVLVVGSLVGISSLGSLRAAQTLTGPLGVVSAAVIAFGVPEVSRRGRLPQRALALAAGASCALLFVSVAYSAVLIALPDSVGTSLFGDTWAGASAVLIAVSAGSVFASMKLGPAIFIAGMGQTKRSFPLVVVLGTTSVVGMAIGGYLGGIVGMAWGMALPQLIVVPLWFLALGRIIRENRPVL